MNNYPLGVICAECGELELVHPPNLPPSGGSLSFAGDELLEFVCGACWEKRPRTWDCACCGGTGPISGNFCSTRHHVRPDPLPYAPDWDAIEKEEREWKREAEALLSEAIREFPGYPWLPKRGVRILRGQPRLGPRAPRDLLDQAVVAGHALGRQLADEATRHLSPRNPREAGAGPAFPLHLPGGLEP